MEAALDASGGTHHEDEIGTTLSRPAGANVTERGTIAGLTDTGYRGFWLSSGRAVTPTDVERQLKDA